MTILADARLDVSIVPSDPTDLDRQYAAETSPFASEGLQCDEPTPAEVLVDWIGPEHSGFPGSAEDVVALLGDADDERIIPRFTTRLAGEPGDTAGGYTVWDEMRARPVKWFRWLKDASNHAEDLNIDDEAPLLINGRPWFECPYPVEAWDGPRITPTTY